MIPRPPSLAQPDPSPGDCPSLMDLAALCDARVPGEVLEQLEAHVAGCARCFALMCGLRAEMREADETARLTLVPAHVLQSAMSLRPRDQALGEIAEVMARDSGRAGPWITIARRGFAA